MHQRFLPSTRALQVFSAVARRQSLSQAADDLALTHSAVSQQLQKLESQLGLKLFDRSARGVTLTDAGRLYRERVDDDLLRLQAHTLELMSLRPGETSLVVGAVPVLAERWLVPRLPDFVAQQPHVTIAVREFPNKLYAYEPPFDIALHYSDAVWPGTNRESLMSESCMAICSPDAPLAQRAKVGDFRQIPLLHLTNRPQAWQHWFADARLKRIPSNPLAGHRFDMFSSLLEAVRSGLGFGLVPCYFAQRDIAEGVLMQAHPHVQKDTQSYSVFSTQQAMGQSAALAFIQWLRSESRH
ncbi:LysR substrate-binding domain-containing protein [Variovorax sp. J31P207]|uniref:LysR substrate-binding domain-containing protein n=1 Tax=Variovorax sp. J31P207 TaxID=3053510 RepID=UPI002576E333|nr:LysR substrate-binding domain-containing protein [Variovorax sp. J31P207]